ncbi:MAG TPA: hypothetical protein DD713_08660 [Nitrospiraceae bacterium]|nr:hypothetical protein [Nitrospiraceae bacterium]
MKDYIRYLRDEMRYFIKIILAVVSITFLFAGLSHAEKVTFVKEYTYQASELDSKASCRTISLEMVKRLLLEELGTYLISETEVKDFKLTKEQIKTYSAGIVGAEITEDKWDGKTYWLKAKVSADPKDVAKSLKKIMDDKFKGKELEEIRKKAEELTKEVERLNIELAKAINKQPSKKIQQEYKAAIQGLTAIEWYDKGFNYTIKKEYDKAIEAYSNSIALNPNNAKAYRYRGYAYADKEQHDRAIEDYNKAIALDPNDAYVYSVRGHAYSNKGQYDKAIEDYNKAIVLVPLQWGDNSSFILPGYYYFRGFAYDKKGQYDKAIKDYNKAIAIDPNGSSAYHFRGRSYAMKGQYDRAIVDYSKAIILTPSYANAETYYERGIVYAGKGQYDKAIETFNRVIEDYNRAIIADYNKAIALNPNDADAYLKRGFAYAKKGQYDKAIEDYNKAIALENTKEKRFVIEEETTAKSGNVINKDDVIFDFKPTIEYLGPLEADTSLIVELEGSTSGLKPVNDPALIKKLEEETRGLVKYKSDEDELAALNSIDLSGLPDKGSTENYNIDNAATLQDEWDNATPVGSTENYNIDNTATHTKRPEFIDPFEPVRSEKVVLLFYAYLSRGEAYAKKGQYDRAIADYNKAIVLDPNNAEAYTGRGVAYAKKEQYDRAIEDFNKTIALDPNNASAYLGRGAAYFLSGNKGRAISDFQKACDMGNEKACVAKNF